MISHLTQVYTVFTLCYHLAYFKSLGASWCASNEMLNFASCSNMGNHTHAMDHVANRAAPFLLKAVDRNEDRITAGSRDTRRWHDGTRWHPLQQQMLQYSPTVFLESITIT